LSRLLLVLPIRAHKTEDGVYIDSQAHNGLRLWLKNFDEVVLACLLVTNQDGPTLPLSTIEGHERLTFVPLPERWLPHKFVGALLPVSKILAREIDRADYLHFAIGGLWGCWPSVASLIAVQRKRRFAVWTDRVESQVARTAAGAKTGLAKIYTLMTAEIMRHYERAIIRRSAIGLFHGADCFDAYAKFCANPHLVHDIHINPSQHISADELDARLHRRGDELRVAYAGRAVADKGVMDWVTAISIARDQGAKLSATWFGTGVELAAAQQLARDLRAPILFPGSLPHGEILDTLKTFDIFMFCHKTLESPRCLIEALACGLPIVGYRSPYPADLISEGGGGVLVDRDDTGKLAEIIVALQDDRIKLDELSRCARLDGQRFSDELVFTHRSSLMRTISNNA